MSTMSADDEYGCPASGGTLMIADSPSSFQTSGKGRVGQVFPKNVLLNLAAIFKKHSCNSGADTTSSSNPEIHTLRTNAPRASSGGSAIDTREHWHLRSWVSPANAK